MQKQGNGKSVVHNKPEYANVQQPRSQDLYQGKGPGNEVECANVMMKILLTFYTSPYHIYKTVLIAKNQINRSQSHRVYLSEENLIECLNIEKENQQVKVCLLE